MNCLGTNTSGNPGDYPQNWYDQGMAVDPNNADRVFIECKRRHRAERIIDGNYRRELTAKRC